MRHCSKSSSLIHAGEVRPCRAVSQEHIKATPVEYNAIHNKSPAINTNFVKLMMFLINVMYEDYHLKSGPHIQTNVSSAHTQTYFMSVCVHCLISLTFKVI